MHVVILGAGRIGQYVAQSLSLDGHSVVLVDFSKEKLQEASQKMDVAVRRGVGTDWKLLEELMEENPELLLALTEEDEVNFVACSIAKSLGNPRTIARAKDFRYVGQSRFDPERLFHVDHIVLPELLVAEQIVKIGLNQGLYSETFFHGSVLLRTIIVPKGWKYARKTLAELRLSEKRMMIGLIRRKKPTFSAHTDISKDVFKDEIIFPHGSDVILENDEITVIGDASFVEDINHFLDVKEVLPASAMIIGGTLVGTYVARELQKRGVQVRLVDSNAELCYKLAEELPGVSILHHPTIDSDFLKTEQVASSQLFVAATLSEEKKCTCLSISERNWLSKSSRSDY